MSLHDCLECGGEYDTHLPECSKDQTLTCPPGCDHRWGNCRYALLGVRDDEEAPTHWALVRLAHISVAEGNKKPSTGKRRIVG